MPRTKVYLKDIAKAAGVSIAMVSYVLNGKHLDRIKEDTANRVRDIALKMNYRPNFIGKALQSQKSDTIGLIVPDLAHPFFMRVAQVIELRLVKYGYTLLIGSTGEHQQKQRDLVVNFINRGVDGLVILPLQDSQDEVAEAINDEVPYFFTDRYFKNSDSNYIVTDNHFGTYALTSSLINNGKSNVALVTLKSSMEHFLMRTRGFLDAIENVENIGSHIIELDPLPDKLLFDEKIDSLLEADPNLDAMVFTTDYLTMYGMRYLLKSGLNERIQIAGFDEAEYYSIYPSPVIYYRQPLDTIGERIVQNILAQIKSPRATKIIQEVIKGDLIFSQ